ncbi:MAG: DUF302 domain-containing protein [Gammaproteobacteria bacterium]|nr:DUF302 domain-containing protein [Gammaproteobacteria bacterium]
MSDAIGFEISLDQPFERAVYVVTEALKTQGFGILSKIDVKATLKNKLDKDFRPYVILGACNPALAYRALSHSAEIGMMLPCNVTVEADGAEASIVRVSNPDIFMQFSKFKDDAVMHEVAEEAGKRIKGVVDSLREKVEMELA